MAQKAFENPIKSADSRPVELPTAGCTLQPQNGSQPTLSQPLDFEHLRTRAHEATEMLKALSHEARLLILCMLTSSEKSVSEIEIACNLPQATVSQHLARLRADQLVCNRREGRQVFYRISDEKAAEIVATLARLYCPPQPADNAKPLDR